MIKRTLYIIPTILISVFCCAFPAPMSYAVETVQLESLMEGFDEDDAPPQDQPDEDIDQVMSGFDDENDDNRKIDLPEKKITPISLTGYLKLGAAWNISHDAPEYGETDWRGLSKLRSEAYVEALTKLGNSWRMLTGGKLFYDAAYEIKGRDDFTQEVLDEYEWDAQWREVYLQGRLGRYMDLKIGRQVVVWGRSDNLRITDVLNPLDFREPGLTDIEDLRLPSAMTRLDGFWGPWSLSGVAVHEIRFNRNPVFGSDFFPNPQPLPPETEPSDGGDNTEWGLSLSGIFSGKDISIYYADLFDDTAHAALGPNGGLIQEHARVSMWGAAGNLALGNWLLKSEAAYWQGLKFFNSQGDTHERIDGLIGVEYSGWDDTTTSLEWAVRHVVDFDSRTKASPDFAQEDEIINALRITRTFSNETVELTLLGLVYGPLGQDGSLFRGSVAYDWSDSVNMILGLVLYQSGDQYALQQIGDNDRLFLEIKYSF